MQSGDILAALGIKIDGVMRGTGSVDISGVVRTCFTSSETKCEKASGESYPGVENANGEACVCISNLCNSAPRGVPTGHLMVIFIGVVCLLALTTQRLLSF